MTDSWHRLGIADLHAAFRSGAATPSAVLAAQLSRIAALDPALRAFVDLDRDGAEAAAAEGDARVAAGTIRPLEGVAVAIKSNIAVAGLSWNAGMKLRRDITAQKDAGAIARLRAAGAMILGTVNMHEAALGATTDNIWFGRTENPHRAGTTPGGSSGGSGAAVAAGLCVAALGTDTMGSIRIPAAYNGVYGLKPTPGAIPDDGLVPLALTLDAIGPLARSLDDVETMWTVLAGLEAGMSPSPKPTRLLLLNDLGGVACEPAVLDAYRRAVGLLTLPLTTLQLPPLTEIRMAGFVTCARELSGFIGTQRTEAAARISDSLHWLLDYADRATLDTTILPTVRDAIRSAIGDDGILLMPCAPQAAFDHGARASADQADFTALANVAGLPALAIPAGHDDRGMPVSVQIVASANNEAALFAVGRQLDQGLAGYAPPAEFDGDYRCVSSSCST